jgi:exonuclease VII small subunit
MNKGITYLLAAALVVSIGFNFYIYNHASSIDKEWKDKYEEALIDVEDATTRLEETRVALEKALKDSEEHRKIAEEALEKLNAAKPKK